MKRSSALLLALSSLAVACKRETSKQPERTASSAAPVPSSRAASANLPRPPLKPPPGARPLEAGGSWQLVRQGGGAVPEPDQQLLLAVRLWRDNGTLNFQASEAAPALLAMGTLPSSIAQAMTSMRVGGAARFWLPEALRRGWMPPDPSAVLIAEVDLIDSRATPPQSIINVPNAPRADGSAYPFPVDASGPRREAATTTTGLRHVRLKPGTGSKLAVDKPARIAYSAFSVAGLSVTRQRDQTLVLTPAQAPEGLGEILGQMTVGEVRRVWAPAAVASRLIPGSGDGDLVLDITAQGGP
jgi:FKBP-type peptidyl-prolyl cis-trans isomerase